MIQLILDYLHSIYKYIIVIFSYLSFSSSFSKSYYHLLFICYYIFIHIYRQCEHSGKVCCISFSNMSKYVISGGENGELIIWDAMTHSRETKLEGHSGTINSLYVNSNDYLLTGGEDKKVILWNMETLTYEKELGCKDVDSGDDEIILEHLSPIVSVSLSYDLNWGISADIEGKVIIWDLKTGIPEAMCTMSAQLNTILYSIDGTTFYCGTSSGVEKWILDWVLTYEGREYPPPIWLLSNGHHSAPPLLTTTGDITTADSNTTTSVESAPTAPQVIEENDNSKGEEAALPPPPASATTTTTTSEITETTET